MTMEQRVLKAQQERRTYGELLEHRERVETTGQVAVLMVTVSVVLAALTALAFHLA